MNSIQSLKFEIINWELLVKCNDLFVRTYFVYFFVYENIFKQIF